MRVLVVGAGHQGLIAALHLARAGLDVEVLEHAPRPGGATSSSELTLPGFVHDHCAGFNVLTPASPAFQELELERHGLEWVDPPTPMAYPLDDGTAIALHRDLDATVASLNASAPGAGDAWRSLVAWLGPHTDAIVRTIVDPLPPVGPPLGLALALRRDGLELGRRFLGSVEAFGLEAFDGATRPTAWLASSAQHSGLPPKTSLSGAFGFLLQLLGHTYGWRFPRGGQGRVAEILVELLAADGGRVRCDAHVDRILVRGGRAAGVRLAGGEEIGADAIVSTVSAGPLYGMLPEEALPHRLMRRLRDWRYGTAAFKLDYALSAPVAWTAPEARSAGVVQVAGELDELGKSAEESGRGVVPERPALVVGQHTLFDATRAPYDGHTLYVYAHVPSQPDVPDDEIAERVEAQIERFAPGWREHVLARSIRNPAQTERENPSLVGGDLGGGSYEIDQQLIFRPAPELSRYRTPLRGLYVAGASTHPGGAVQGMSGRGAARALLSDRRLRPWRWRGGRA